MENVGFPKKWLSVASEGMRLAAGPFPGPNYYPDVYIASSVLQKALRRSDGSHAHGAGQFLLKYDPSRLWRRLVVIAFEDFGPGRADLLGLVCSVAANSAWRKQNGGEKKALAFVTDRLLGAPRDRATDDCYMAAVAAVDQVSAINCTRSASTELRELVFEAAKVVRGCERVIHPQKFRSILAERCETELNRRLAEGTINCEMMPVLKQGYRTSRCLLPVIASLFADCASLTPATTQQNCVPAVLSIAGVPSYAFDGYTRMGKVALSAAVRRLPGLAKVFQGIQPPINRSKALYAVLFAAEGGLCTTEFQSSLRGELKAVALCSWAGMPSVWLEDAVGRVTEAIPFINEVRARLALEMVQPRQMELWNGK